VAEVDVGSFIAPLLPTWASRRAEPPMDYNIKTEVKFGAPETFDAGQMSREGA
jgi:hypothetical protein